VTELPTSEAFLLDAAVAVCVVFGACTVVALCDGPLRPEKAISSLVTFVALFSILLVRAPYLLRHTADEGFASLLPFIAAIAWMLVQPKRRVYRPLVVLVLICIALLAIALFRGKAAGVGTGGTQEILAFLGSVVALSVFGVLLFATARDKTETWWRLAAVALAPAVYVGFNVILRFAGFSSTTEAEPLAVSYAAGTPAKTLALIGIHVNREAFPMNPSINGMGVVAAVGLVTAALLALRTHGLTRRAGIVGAIMCLVALLLTDTRTALILAIVVIALLAFVRRTRVALLLAIVIPFSSWLVTNALSFLSTTGLATPLARSATDVSTGNGRTFIWQAAQQQFAKFDVFHTLFGYGANGQASSGASRQYVHLFEGVPFPLLVHVHNLGLQVLLDTGVVGLAVLVLTAVLGLDRLERLNNLSPRGPATALVGGVLMLYLTGATEPSPTYRSQETLVFSMLLLSAAAGLALQTVDLPVAVSRRRSSTNAQQPISSTLQLS
jgi:O-antigen ligase